MTARDTVDFTPVALVVGDYFYAIVLPDADATVCSGDATATMSQPMRDCSVPCSDAYLYVVPKSMPMAISDMVVGRCVPARWQKGRCEG